MSEFTKGPWEILGDDERRGIPYIEICSGQLGTDEFYPVAEISAELRGKVFEINATTRANARLIAAAPDLYEALKTAIAHIHDLRIILDECREMGMTIHMCGVTYDDSRARAALAKAEGVSA